MQTVREEMQPGVVYRRPLTEQEMAMVKEVLERIHDANERAKALLDGIPIGGAS